MLYQICKLLCQNFENSSHIWHNVPANKHMTMSKIWLLHTCYVLHVLRAARATVRVARAPRAAHTHTYLAVIGGGGVGGDQGRWWPHIGPTEDMWQYMRTRLRDFLERTKLYSIFFSHRRNYFSTWSKKSCVLRPS